MHQVAFYFLAFITYSVIGWIIETIYTSVRFKYLTNRGYLLGPLCPIYGVGAVAVLLLVGTNETDLLTIFLKSIFIAAILEYFTSFWMEKLFKTRWWDYSEKRFNLNGRICLETMIPFGILNIILIRFVHPRLAAALNSLNPTLLIAIAVIIFILYVADNIVSYIVMQKIRNQIKSRQHEDNTENIKNLMYEWLDEHSILFRRLKNAYPGFLISNLQKRKAPKTRKRRKGRHQ